MSVFALAKAARNARNRVEIRWNRRRGRELIPARRDQLWIETSSLCNLACRFCAYPKKESAKTTMPHELFVDLIEQATELGFRRFAMTPCTGDVFMDRGLFRKLEFLDAHPRVTAYDFFTNLTIPKPGDVARLVRFEKLVELTISVYGHDRESFVAITDSDEKLYERLIANLEALLAELPLARTRLAIGWRSTPAGRRTRSELRSLLERFQERGIRVRRSRVFNNWGGYVTEEDVRELGIEVTDAEATYKNGACALLFTSIQVLANGLVNGCACRDVEATLRIGDATREPLRAILSTDNPAWRRLIEEQQAGRFQEVCRACDFYRSIYHMRSDLRRSGERLQTLPEYLDSPLGAH